MRSSSYAATSGRSISVANSGSHGASEAVTHTSDPGRMATP